MRFTPSGPLDPLTLYDVTLSWDCGPTHSSWTTSAVGAPVPDPSALVGRSWLADIGGARWVEPPGVGPLLQQQFDNGLFLGVTAEQGTTLELLSARSLEGLDLQDTCVPTVVLPAPADFSENPYFSAGPVDLDFAIEGIEFTLTATMISGAFTEDTTAIEGMQWLAELDTRLEPVQGLLMALESAHNDPQGPQ